MKHLAAYSLLVLAGNPSPSADDVSKLLKEVGVAPEKESLDQLIKALKGKKLHELVRDGSKKLASVPSGGAAAPTGAVAAGATTAAPEVKEAKKEEEAADVDMGGLFGDEEY